MLKKQGSCSFDDFEAVVRAIRGVCTIDPRLVDVTLWHMDTSPPGLFIVGTDTEVGKTYVTAQIAQQLLATGKRVGVYKPVASGCQQENGQYRSPDAECLWQAAGWRTATALGSPARKGWDPHLRAPGHSRSQHR